MNSMPFAKFNFRKFLKILPVAAFVLTLALYYLFSFLRTSQVEATPDKSAFNTKLPAPKLDDRYKNKLDIYMEAHQDSLRRLKEARKDSLFFPIERPAEIEGADLPDASALPRRQTSPADVTERKLEAALEKLQVALTQQPNLPGPVNDPMATGAPAQTQPAPDIAQLEKLMNTAMTASADSGELKRLDGMLDKILAIAQPGRSSSPAVTQEDTLTPQQISTAGHTSSEEFHNVDANGFYGISEDEGYDKPSAQPPGNGTITAVVHADQRVRTGSIVRLRLLQDMYINKTKVPATSFVFGVATVSKERVELDIRHAVYENTVFPLKLAVFDTDGIPGISAPGADARDAGREGIGQAVQNLELYSMDPSIGAQAAASGIQAAKSLLSKKTKTPYALLKADHKVMLVNSRF